MNYTFIKRSHLYNERLHSTGDAYGNPFDMVTITHAESVVSKAIATGLATARPPFLRALPYASSEMLRKFQDPNTEPSEGLSQEWSNGKVSHPEPHWHPRILKWGEGTPSEDAGLSFPQYISNK